MAIKYSQDIVVDKDSIMAHVSCVNNINLVFDLTEYFHLVGVDIILMYM